MWQQSAIIFQIDKDHIPLLTLLEQWIAGLVPPNPIPLVQQYWFSLLSISFKIVGFSLQFQSNIQTFIDRNTSTSLIILPCILSCAIHLRSSFSLYLYSHLCFLHIPSLTYYYYFLQLPSMSSLSYSSSTFPTIDSTFSDTIPYCDTRIGFLLCWWWAQTYYYLQILIMFIFIGNWILLFDFSLFTAFTTLLVILPIISYLPLILVLTNCWKNKWGTK